MPTAALPIKSGQLLPFRAAQTHLSHRLPTGAHEVAAWGGLQDTVPRAALTALHARLEAVTPDAWEHPSLWQIWFRMSDYVVPARDFGVFTAGAMPRRSERSRPLLRLADAVVEVLDGRRLGNPEVVAALNRRGGLGDRSHFLLREACCAGRYRIRWDARTVTLIPTPPPAIDAEEARRELARRFLRWHGPGTVRRFAIWAHVPPEDASETFRQLGSELLPVTLDGESRFLHAGDEQALREAGPAPGVRFLMQGDPVLAADRELIEPAPASLPEPVVDDRGRDVTRRLRNSLAGRVLVDGVVAGSWGRREHHLSVHLWRTPDAGTRRRVLAEAESFAAPFGRTMRVSWLSS